MAETQLTKQQINFFNTFGYLYFPGLMADCVDRIIPSFELVWTNHGGGHHGKQHGGQARSCIVPFADQDEYLSSLLDDTRIHDIAAGILGDDFNYTSGDGNLYVGDTNWHSDGYNGERIPSIKIAFYLDPLTADTGAVRIIPGSHHCGDTFSDGLEKEIKDCTDTWGLAPDEVPSLVIETQPGDVVVFWHNTKHAAFGGSKRRRMFTMNFYEHVPDHRLEEFQNALANEGRFWIDRIHGEKMLRSATSERMVHLKQVMENDFKVKEVHARLREERNEPSRG
ncbi:MAG: phytanoyl-CoA dioxygenase family protein [Gemmatimonadota bacterium]|nr:phytanoyl-CoA dioxygenase family protein [Gemmatimonadota bacterium]